MQCRFNALIFALANAGRSMAARMAMIAMTTSNSMSVKADRAGRPARDSVIFFIKFMGGSASSFQQRHCINLNTLRQPVKGFFVRQTTYNIMDDVYDGQGIFLIHIKAKAERVRPAFACFI